MIDAIEFIDFKNTSTSFLQQTDKQFEITLFKFFRKIFLNIMEKLKTTVQHIVVMFPVPKKCYKWMELIELTL